MRHALVGHAAEADFPLDDDGRTAGYSVRYARATLTRAIRRVGEMSEEERARFRVLPPPAPEGTPQRTALELRARGMPYPDIAETLGADEATIRQWVNRQLDRWVGDEVRSVDKARVLQSIRLDMLMHAQWPKAEQGSTASADVVLKIMDRQAKLLGLDAPIRINVEDRIREMALAEGLDPEEALDEARAIIRSLEK
jgi:hypothetical protein